jgi:hypothetical protein
VSTSSRWSAYAGVYAFLCGVALTVPLGFVAGTLVKVLGLPTALTAVLVPGSGAVAGAVAWWAVVERPEAYGYLRGGLAGLVTVLLTVLFWAHLIAVVWAPEFLALPGTVLTIGVVLAVTAPAGFVAGLPLLYLRRRLAGERPGGDARALSTAAGDE